MCVALLLVHLRKKEAHVKSVEFALFFFCPLSCMFDPISIGSLRSPSCPPSPIHMCSSAPAHIAVIGHSTPHTFPPLLVHGKAVHSADCRNVPIQELQREGRGKLSSVGECRMALRSSCPCVY